MIEVLILAVALSMDAFAVSIGLGSKRVKKTKSLAIIAAIYFENRGQVIPILQSPYLFLVCFGLVNAYKKLRYIQIQENQEDDKIKQNFDGNKNAKTK